MKENSGFVHAFLDALGGLSGAEYEYIKAVLIFAHVFVCSR